MIRKIYYSETTGENPSLRVWHFKNSSMTHYAVDDIEEAKRLINQLILDDLADENIFVNTFGLEERESNGDYCEWYNDDAESILDIMDREGEES